MKLVPFGILLNAPRTSIFALRQTACLATRFAHGEINISLLSSGHRRANDE